MAMENGLNPSSNLGGGMNETFKSHTTDDTKNSLKAKKFFQSAGAFCSPMREASQLASEKARSEGESELIVFVRQE